MLTDPMRGFDLCRDVLDSIRYTTGVIVFGEVRVSDGGKSFLVNVQLDVNSAFVTA